MQRLTFTRWHMGYAPGEVALFDDDAARRLVGLRVAVPESAAVETAEVDAPPADKMVRPGRRRRGAPEAETK